MSEGLKIVLTAGLTIVGSVVVFAVSQIMQRRLIDPILEQRKVIGEIDVALAYWANVIGNPMPGPAMPFDPLSFGTQGKAIDELRSLAARLRASTNAIWFNWLTKRLDFISLKPVALDVSRDAAKRLIRLSNSIFVPPGRNPSDVETRNDADMNAIRALLGIPGEEA
jgi:hypothetical protein